MIRERIGFIRDEQNKRDVFEPEYWETKLRRLEYLTFNEIRRLLQFTTAIMATEPNLVKVDLPVVICGDIHGQMFDLLNLFELAGRVKDTNFNYVFLGDMVDRGKNSVEVLSYLLVLKLMYPNRVTLLRGNHESRKITTVYGFYDECNQKYDSPEIWELATEAFDVMPLAAIIGEKTLCVHGGLSPKIRSLEQIRLIMRNQEIPTEGSFCDLLWSDPDEVEKEWAASPRGAGFLFGAPVVREFMFRNRLDLIVRSHQLVFEGFKYHFNEEEFCTVWSAPNYCYRCENLASVLRLYEDASRQVITFEEVDKQFDEDGEFGSQNGARKCDIPYFV